MKTMMKRFLCAVICLMMIFAMIPAAMVTDAAAAGENEAVANARNGVVRVVAMSYLDDGMVSFGIGSAFGIGTVGEPTDIFVTNNHCVIVEDRYGRNSVADRVYLAVDKNSINVEYTALVTSWNDEIKDIVSTVDVDESRVIACDVIYQSAAHDIAILRAVEPVKSRVALELAPKAESAVPSDTVYALGYPSISDETLDLDDTWKSTNKTEYTQYGETDYYTSSVTYASEVKDVTVTNGVVSRLASMEVLNEGKAIQHDAEIHSGSSGGPLINSKGQVIGVNFYAGSAASTNYAVYIDYVRDALKLDSVQEELNSDFVQDALAGGSKAVTPTKPDPTEPTKSGSVDPEPNYAVIIMVAAGVLAVAAVVVILIANNNKKKKATAAKQMQAQAAAVAAAVAQANVRKPYVRSLAPQHGNMRLPLRSSDAVLIGRSKADCAITFSEKTPGVSGRHCSLQWNGSAFILTDLNSTYGTFLQNGQKLTPNMPCTIQPGTTFWLGDKQNALRVELE